MAKTNLKILGPFTSVYPFYKRDVGDCSHNFYVLEQEHKNGDILCGALYQDKILVECKYDAIGPCHDGTFFAKEKGIWKLVSVSGKTLREFGSFDGKPIFSKLIVHGDAGWGVMDKDGKFIIPCQYTGFTPLERTSTHIFAAHKHENEIWLFDEEGKCLTTRCYETIGLCDMYSGSGPYEAVNDMIDLEWRDSQSGVRGTVMFNCKLKKEVSECEYGIEVSTRSTSLCSDTFRMYRDGVVQLCDTSGRILIPFEEGYSYLGQVPYLSDEEYLFPARKDTETEYVYINRYGVQKIRNSFAGAGLFKNGMAQVAYNDGVVLNWGIIDRHGNLIVKPIFSLIDSSFRVDGHFIIKGELSGQYHTGWNYYNAKGETYEIISEDGTVCPDGSCDMRVDGLKLYCNQKSNDYSTDSDNDTRATKLWEDGYHSIRSTSHRGQLYVKEFDGKYGIFDRFRREVFPPEFDNIEHWAESVIDGIIRADKDNQCYLLFL